MKRVILTAVALALFAACCLFSHSCAKTTTPPSGGPKDTLPPVLLKVTPLPGVTGFPLTDGKISLVYNEYTVVKTATDILLSPPTKRRPIAKVKGKSIVITLQDTLRADQTYNIDFGQALADNNEGNLAPRMVFTFSTGDSIDSLYFTGSVLDSKTLSPVKNALVTAYTDLSDSACFNALPNAIVKTDEWGFFALRNLRDTIYQVFVFSDTDGNFKYNPDEDKIGFLDSLYRPTTMATDSTYELRTFDMSDSARCSVRESMITLLLFKELQTTQYLQNSGRKTERQGFLKFSAGNVEINSLEFVGIPDSSVILQYNPTRDSIDFWINTDYRLDDSLLIRLNYMKTDSTGVLSPAEENLALAVKSEESLSMSDRDKQKNARPDTVFRLTVTAQDETVEQLGVTLDSNLPLLQVVRDSIRLMETNPKGQKTEKPFSLTQDTLEIRRYVIRPAEQLIKGYDYELTIPQGTFFNLDHLPNALATAKFKVPQSEELSTMQIRLTGVDSRYIVELTDEKGSKVFRTYHTETEGVLDFPYIKAGKYMIRITRDKNRNGIADTGNLLERRQPETVRYFESKPGDRILDIPESVEIEQNIDLKELFR